MSSVYPRARTRRVAEASPVVQPKRERVRAGTGCTEITYMSESMCTCVLRRKKKGIEKALPVPLVVTFGESRLRLSTPCLNIPCLILGARCVLAKYSICSGSIPVCRCRLGYGGRIGREDDPEAVPRTLGYVVVEQRHGRRCSLQRRKLGG